MSRRNFCCLLFVFSVLAMSSGIRDSLIRVTAQDTPAEKPAAATPPPTGPPAAAPTEAAQQAIGAFVEGLEAWKQVIKEMRSLRTRFQVADESELKPLQDEWQALVDRGEKLIPVLRDAGKRAFLAAPNQDREIIRFLYSLLLDDLKRDNYEPAIDVAEALLENNVGIGELYELAGVAAFATHDFETAERYLKEADTRGALTRDDARKFLATVTEYKQLWATEQALRKAEAEADDLPRVELKTNRGTIVLELFENEAPGTVGNFISLVKEKKFYDNLTFHRVLGGFMAQGGCPKGDGTGDPGYSIKCECGQENARKHFRGSLSMANAGPDTGGSQFFITFQPRPSLNGKHSVFGRVIEGIEVLARIQRRDPAAQPPLPEPDRILSATVIRDRGHKYEPNKVAAGGE